MKPSMWLMDMYVCKYNLWFTAHVAFVSAEGLLCLMQETSSGDVMFFLCVQDKCVFMENALTVMHADTSPKNRDQQFTRISKANSTSVNELPQNTDVVLFLRDTCS